MGKSGLDEERCGAHQEAIEGLKKWRGEVTKQCREDMEKMRSEIDGIKARGNLILGGVLVTVVGVALSIILQLILLKLNGFGK